MTLHLALDPTGRDDLPLPDGRIAGINRTEAGLRGAGYAADPYTGQRLVSIDETDAAVWDADCEPGWYYVSGAVKATLEETDTETYNRLLEDGQALYLVGDDIQLPKLLVWEKTDPRITSGHTWVDDIIRGWGKPSWRDWESKMAAWRALLVDNSATPQQLAAAKAAAVEAWDGPSSGPRQGAGLKREFDALGYETWYGAADQGTNAWRAPALLAGTLTYRTALAPGGNGKFGYLAGSAIVVAYPTGETVATWNMRSAVLALEAIT